MTHADMQSVRFVPPSIAGATRGSWHDERFSRSEKGARATRMHAYHLRHSRMNAIARDDRDRRTTVLVHTIV